MTNLLSTIGRTAFTKAVEIASLAVSPKIGIDALRNLRVRTSEPDASDPHEVIVVATDLAFEISVKVPAIDPVSSLDLALPAKKTLEILKKGREGDVVDLKRHDPVGDDQLTSLRVGGIDYVLPSIDGEHIPSLSRGVDRKHIYLKTADFLPAFESVLDAMSTEEVRYYLNGVHMHTNEDHELVFVATDGMRLFSDAIDIAVDDPGAIPTLTVPARFATVLVKLLKRKDVGSTLVLALSDTYVVASFHCADMSVVVSTKTIDGTFPDYRRIVPTCESGIMVDGRAFGEAAAAVSLIGDKHDKLTIDMRSGGVSYLGAEGSKPGTKAVCDVASTLAGGAMRIGFNASYLQGVLDMLQPDPKGAFDDLQIGAIDENSPTLWRRAGNDRRYAVLMPRR